ncbi:MAG: M20/M25/M40 family metallo-hydrolase [Fuerstiella sp.]|nr:M20/M25/M40 family metallo-hydrolase [Fuerstiella sp.]
MPNINANAAIRRVLELIAIPGGSGAETKVSACIQKTLVSAGLPQSVFMVDTANRRSPIGGATGNLIVKLKGTKRAPRRLLMAHMDTVPLAVDSEPVRQGDWIRPKSSDTALGADNRAGCAVILTAILEMLKQNIDHPPLTLLFTVQEEVGLCGARHVTTGRLANPQLCFNWDGRDPASLVIGAVGATNVAVKIDGIASHAGVNPDDGVNAAIVASLALSELHENGWHGLVVKGSRQGTCNVGSVHGGSATNVVMPEVVLQAEARSHSSVFRDRIVREIHRAFERAIKRVRNTRSQSGRLTIKDDSRYNAFRISPKADCVRMAAGAVKMAGLLPQTVVSNGGLDANWTTAHGFPTVTLGCGQHAIHTVKERLNIPEYLSACSIALSIATAE